jgi:hypothetical protein
MLCLLSSLPVSELATNNRHTNSCPYSRHHNSITTSSSSRPSWCVLWRGETCFRPYYSSSSSRYCRQLSGQWCWIACASADNGSSSGVPASSTATSSTSRTSEGTGAAGRSGNEDVGAGGCGDGGGDDSRGEVDGDAENGRWGRWGLSWTLIFAIRSRISCVLCKERTCLTLSRAFDAIVAMIYVVIRSNSYTTCI